MAKSIVGQVDKKSKNGRQYSKKYDIDCMALALAYQGGLSMGQCAARFGVPRPTIRNYLVAAGVVSRKRKVAQTLDEASLRAAYDGGMTIRGCADLFEVSVQTVKNYCRRFNIKSRGRRGRRILRGSVKALDRHAVIAMYREGASLQECAKRFGIPNESTVARVLANAGVNRRREREPRADSPYRNGVARGDKSAYRHQLRKRYRSKIREYERRRRAASVNVRLSQRMSNAIRQALRRGKIGRPWKSMVHYSLADLRAHLQATMPEGCTWDDFMSGRLHIDHKIPRSAFHYETPDDYDFRRCWALENLQLLTAVDNWSKGNRLSVPFQPTLL